MLNITHQPTPPGMEYHAHERSLKCCANSIRFPGRLYCGLLFPPPNPLFPFVVLVLTLPFNSSSPSDSLGFPSQNFMESTLAVHSSNFLQMPFKDVFSASIFEGLLGDLSAAISHHTLSPLFSFFSAVASHHF